MLISSPDSFVSQKVILDLSAPVSDLSQIIGGLNFVCIIWDPGETLINPICIELEPGLIAFQKPNHYEPLANQTHYAELTLKINVEPSALEVKGSVMNMSLV